MQLLRVCFSPMMIAIWMNRSIMQPLRWHCGAIVKVRDGAQRRKGTQELGVGSEDRLTSSSFHRPARRVDFPG